MEVSHDPSGDVRPTRNGNSGKNNQVDDVKDIR